MSVESTSFPTEPEKQSSSLQSCTAESRANRSLYERLPINTQLQLCWEERKGVQRQVRVRAVDANKCGVQVDSGLSANLNPHQFTVCGRD